MQFGFGFGSTDIALWHRRLQPVLSLVEMHPLRPPVAQLVKSIISSRTRDEVSAEAFRQLRCAFGSAGSLAAASPKAVERIIADVTFAADKAMYVVDAMRQLGTGPFGYRLERLGDAPIAEGLGFLETLPGVGRKVSASTLNASTLAMPVMIVDTHVLRVLQRLRFVPDSARYRAACDAVTQAMPGWTGADFLNFHSELKLLGQTVCRPKRPQCGNCPLARDCPSFALP